MIIKNSESNRDDKRKYKVVDNYDLDMETIGYCDTLDEIAKIARERCEDTDGECTILYYPINESTGKYQRKESKLFYSYC